MDDNLLYNIIDKLVSGRNDWTLEELQFQQNYPNEIEQALKALHRKNSKSFVVLHSGCSLLQCSGKKTLTYPEAIILALHVLNLLGDSHRVAVLAYDDEFLDMAVVYYDDGVFDFEYAAFVPSVNSEAVYSICNEGTRNVKGPVDKVFVVTNGHYDFSYEQLAGCVFGVEAELMTNLKQLIKRGAEIKEGIINGSVKNALLLPVISQAVGVEDADGNMLNIIEANTNIPCRNSRQIMLDASASKIGVKIWQGNDSVAKKNVVVANLSVMNDCVQIGTKRLVEIMVDIDSIMSCRCRLTDTKTGRMDEVFVGK